MAKNGRKQKGAVTDETLREMIEFQRIGNRAVHKAQEENRRLGIPNWYSLDGKIVSDQEVSNNSSLKDTAEHENGQARDWFLRHSIYKIELPELTRFGVV